MNRKPGFEWDDIKDLQNEQKHGVSFYTAQYAFFDLNRIILEDDSHSNSQEVRFFCLGYDELKHNILTVRFTYRVHAIRIFGAGYWRKGRKIYENKNSIL